MLSTKILEKTNWPKKVAVFTENLVDAAIEEGLLEEFPEIKREWLYEALCAPVFERFCNGHELFPDEEEFTKAIAVATASSSMEYMKQLGLVDWIEDENGEEIIFLTEAGKKEAEDVRNLFEKNS